MVVNRYAVGQSDDARRGILRLERLRSFRLKMRNNRVISGCRCSILLYALLYAWLNA